MEDVNGRQLRSQRQPAGRGSNDAGEAEGIETVTARRSGGNDFDMAAVTHQQEVNIHSAEANDPRHALGKADQARRRALSRCWEGGGVHAVVVLSVMPE
jgi:hypothetical protein